MTTAPGKARLQVTVPEALKVELDQLAASAGMPTNALATVFIAQGVSASRPPASPVAHRTRQPMGQATSEEFEAESESLGAEGDEPELGEDGGYTATEILAMLPPDGRDALLAEGWTVEQIDAVLGDE